jgi:prepilin-type N-terminal cleavage/methylation domain-containing protein
MTMGRRGMSLIEVMISMALISVGLLLVGALFQFGVKISLNAEERNALQGDRLRLSRKLQRSLVNSYRSGNTAFYVTEPGPQDDLAICLITQDSWDDTEQIALFGGYDIYYRLNADNTLRHSKLAITPTDVASPLTETQVRDAITADPGAALLESVTSFQLYIPANGVVADAMTNPIGLRLIQQTTRDTDLTTELTYRFVSP